MKKKITSLLCVLVSSVSLGQNIADGKTNDWVLPLKYYDSQAHLQYSATNNDSMLFICVRIPEEKFQMKVSKGGMTLFIDTTGKKKQNIAVNFPIKPLNPGTIKKDAGSDDKNSFPGSGTNKILYIVEPTLKKFNTNGFIAGNGTYNLKNIEGIIAVGAFDSLYVLTIEYQIPFKTFYHKLNGEDKERKITLSLVVNGMPVPQMGDVPPGGPPMGGGMPSGGPSIGGGGNMPSPEEMEAFFQSTTTTLKYSFIIKH